MARRRTSGVGGAGLLLALLACCDHTGCKVPLTQVAANFDVSDAAWFEEEQTLFFFWSSWADQGIGPESVLEVTYTTDTVSLPWTDVTTLPMVHPHEPVDCGVGRRCGSASLAVALPPRGVGIRLRYARGGAMTLTPTTNYAAVLRGNPWSNRSLVVYGVFDEPNERIQWRGRHLFPTIHNETATHLGLRRRFLVAGETHGTLGGAEQPASDNPYGYGFAPDCPTTFATLPGPPTETTARAAFNSQALPLSASTSTQVCATSTVFDATGAFVTPALARKNPQVKPAFPALRSPIRDEVPVRFLLKPCQRTISEDHLAMQKQRLRFDGSEEVLCLDAWSDDVLEDGLVARLSARLDAQRALGQDLVLVLAVHHDDESGTLAMHLERVLQRVLAPEVVKSTPRTVGAFILDSYGHRFLTPGLGQHSLWCPGMPDNTASGSSTCALQLGFPDLALGPLTVGLPLPILPTRKQYLDFIATYSQAQAGEMKKLSFRGPERTATSTDRAIGDFGVATFFNQEGITAEPGDVFSYCALDPVPPVVFTPLPGGDMLPISVLPQVHAAFPQARYQLGLAWAFPWLVQLDYVSVVAGKLTAYALRVPFGIASDEKAFVGSEQWTQETVPMADALAQCTRFCDQPTFDSDGVYQVLRPFTGTYEALCYRPVFPRVGNGGFPGDP